MAEDSLYPVCPDDLETLEFRADDATCTHCLRSFPRVCGILELLPRQSASEASAENAQLKNYENTFSGRPDAKWLHCLRLAANHLGNGYLYHWAARTLKSIGKGPNCAILDAACGDGMFHRFLPEHRSYVGIDFSSRLLQRANRHSPAIYFRGDLHHLPFRDQTFDVVVSLQALQYVHNPKRALEQLSRVLKADGYLLLSVPNDLSFKYRWQGIPAIQAQRFDDDRIRDLIAPGFRLLSLQPRGFWVPLPRVPVHVPGRYSLGSGLSWTLVAQRLRGFRSESQEPILFTAP